MAQFVHMMFLICGLAGWTVIVSADSVPCVSAPECASEEPDEMPLLNLRQKRASETGGHGKPTTADELEGGVSPPAPTPAPTPDHIRDEDLTDAAHTIETNTRERARQAPPRMPNGSLNLVRIGELMGPIDRIEVTEVRDMSHKDDPHTIHPRTEGAGTVAGLYTIGSPSSAWPAMRNTLSKDGCFPGSRAVNRADLPGWVWGIYPHVNDYVTWSATRLGWFHPLMDMIELVGEDPASSVVDTCSFVTTTLPAPDDTRAISLHASALYMSNFELLSQANPSYSLAHIMSRFAALVAYIDDPAAAAEEVTNISTDWSLVGWAQNEGHLFRTKDSSCLVQNKDTLDCVLTFQGSEEPSDFVTDLWAFSVEFCGFADSEDYDADGNKQPKNGSSFVHAGFRNQLMRIVDTEPFQTGLKPKLSKCNQVYVTGHSLGGAMAELFTGCAHRAPVAGDPGHEHYTKIAWTSGTPELMPAYTSSR